MAFPDGYEVNNDDNYIVKLGETYYTKNGHEAGIAGGFARSKYTVSDLRECGYYLAKIKKKNINPMKIPEGFEINDDDNYKIKYGEKFYSLSGIEAGTAQGFAGQTVASFRNNYGYYVIRPKIPKTPEAKAKDFVDRNIKNPSKEIYQKFQDVFSRDDNFGL